MVWISGDGLKPVVTKWAVPMALYYGHVYTQRVETRCY
jgi:hypothetical protein